MLGKLMKWTVPLLAGSALAITGSQTFAATTTINPVNDTTIYQGVDPVTGENFELNSCGGGVDMYSGVTNDGLLRRALLKFDIAGSIPDGSTINSVTLTVDVNRSGDNQDAPMALSPLTRAWGEGVQNCSPIRGGGVGAPAASGDATWLDAMFQQVFWTSPGGDFPNQSASALIPTRGDGIWSSAGMVADVQGWLDAPANNNGWIIVGDEGRSSTTRRFNSREGGAPPALSVDFTPPGTVEACCQTDGSCSLTLEGSGDCTGTTLQGIDSCEPNQCPQPTGACCNLDESCEAADRASCEASGGFFQGQGSSCSDNAVDCGLTPFMDALPIPPALVPTGTNAQGWPQYTVNVVATSQQLHNELPATDVWTYNGAYPSFTIEARSGQPIEVTYNNNLPTARGNRGSHLLEVDECPHGPNYYGDSARIVTHLHGGHLPARFDGQPEYTILPGETDVYQYPNNQEAATLWYHDHALGITRLNVYGGMAGFYLLRDDFEDGLGLPGPAPQVGDAPGTEYFEIPLVIQDREFNPDGSLFYPPTIQNAFFGDKILVNGKVWPFLNVKQGKYRFRLLNGSQARSYALRLENQADPAQVIPFTLIGTDLGLIDGPIPLDSISEMAPAERFDVIVDFSGFQPGTEIVLRNDDPSTPLIPNVMKFVVQQGSGFTGGIPTALRPVEPIPEGDATVTRYFRLENVAESCAGNEWIVQTLDGPNGNPVSGETHWDDIIGDGLIGDTPLQLGSTEIWQFENPSNIMHPMHVHLVAFQVLDRTPIGGGQALQLEPWELNTWKDVVRVPPDTAVRVIARYEDYLGKFPTHCHILDHEDHEMMRQFQVSNDPANCNNNGACEAGEDCISCPNDCAQQSGAHCGNGLCEAGDGENCLTCAEDCAGKQKGSASKQFCCGAPGGTNNISCGDNAADNRCVDASANLFCRIAPRVKACCGDAMCEGEETEISCAVDCSAEPPQPPVCTRADPTVSISPASGEITNDGGTAGYTVNITNNDTAACADSTFNLSVSDSDTGANFVVPSTLGQDSVSLAPAANTNVSLTVTGQQQGATDGATNDSSVTAADPAANHADVTSNTVTTTINVGAGGTCEGILDRTQCRNDPTCQWKKGACVTR